MLAAACQAIRFTCGRSYSQAAILAARRNLKEISKEEISDALERIVAGPEKKGAIVTEAKKRLVAYHEVRGAARREGGVPCCAPANVCRAGCWFPRAPVGSLSKLAVLLAHAYERACEFCGAETSIGIGTGYLLI